MKSIATKHPVSSTSTMRKVCKLLNPPKICKVLKLDQGTSPVFDKTHFPTFWNDTKWLTIALYDYSAQVFVKMTTFLQIKPRPKTRCVHWCTSIRRRRRRRRSKKSSVPIYNTGAKLIVNFFLWVMQKVPIFTDTSDWLGSPNSWSDLNVQTPKNVFKKIEIKNSFFTYKSFGWRISLSSTLSKQKKSWVLKLPVMTDFSAATTTKGPRMHLFNICLISFYISLCQIRYSWGFTLTQYH